MNNESKPVRVIDDKFFEYLIDHHEEIKEAVRQLEELTERIKRKHQFPELN